ncbi:MAG: UDP-N-acetylglucosamine 2-epimerase [Nitrospirota bacterium]
MLKIKICIITGTRAEYGLFYPLLKSLKRDDDLCLQIVATGMHLSPEFGLTYKEIVKDGFRIDEKVEMLLDSDSETGISKSIGLGIIGFTDAFCRLKPHLVMILGDRFESFASAVSAFVLRIPIAHIHGGEVTEGVIDDALRHSITKMSFFHFTSTERYRKRVIQLGESPDRVFNVGALGLDNIKETGLLSKSEIEGELGFRFPLSSCPLPSEERVRVRGKTALVTYHPVTLEVNSSKQQFKKLLHALIEFKDLKVIFTKPNADMDTRVITRLIDEYVRNNPEKAVSFQSLGRLRYLSAMRYIDIVIGNSSSGIIETPSFGKPTVNIGDRQKGRIKAESVIDCRGEIGEIKAAIKKALSDRFQQFCKTVKNPYGDGRTSERIITILKDRLSRSISLKKGFFDIKTESINERYLYL